ncbi:hypothetical protein [Chromatocurvus halotolerans]|uniref:Uncharacterized protein n=1 Tax=Chromatocurvus halotolerans TaxID=1132028 RepID=A0A4R2K8L1_9GAMM|nr:hypothetical protein [Chromatocurvus halotolerans]TCO69711.1 hypothetical protein EV688_1305 [Chromatocurvus halotolerans]
MSELFRALLRGLRKFLKWSLILVAVMSLGGLSYLAVKRHHELTYMTKHDWQFQDSWLDGGTQWRKATYDNDLPDTIILRRVYPDDRKSVYALLNQDQSLFVVAFWHVECVVGTEITTSAKYGNGDPFVLTCDEDAELGTTYLTTTATFESGYRDAEWRQNFDGFWVNENFGGYKWDFSEAVKLRTIQRAVKPSASNS